MIKQIILLTILMFQLVLGCESPKAEENIKKEKIMNQKFNNNIISEWLDLRKLNLSSFSQEEITKVENVKYEGLQNLTRVNLDSDISKYYFFDKEGDCIIIYINNEDDLGDLSVKNIVETYGEPEEILKSRVGKRAKHYVYSQNGFAFSVLDDKISFFEIFRDSTLENYKENIYVRPPELKKLPATKRNRQ